MTNRIKPYKKDFDYSYTLGAYSTIELLKTKPEVIEQVYIHSAYKDSDSLKSLCDSHNVSCSSSDKIFNIASQKENNFVLAVFRKYTDTLSNTEPHIVLVNPSDMGNVGTIIRTAVGMNIKNIAIIQPATDVWNPKAVRASMGAIFHVKLQRFKGFCDYTTMFQAHSAFPFILNGDFTPEEIEPCRLFSLIFGNEASGLDKSFENIGKSVKIPLSGEIDSFNLSVAAGIGMYQFARKNKRI